MENYAITCESTVDLSRDFLAQKNILWVPFHYELDGQDHFDDLFQSISDTDFYAAMAAGAQTKTSQVSIGEYLAFFKPLLEAGQDILHVSLSSGLSGTVSSAEIAAKQLQEEYPARKIFVLDSLCASSGYGLFVATLADKRADGMAFDELCTWAENNRLHLHHWFFSTDLTFYVRGGRISKAAGLVGTALKICPLLNMDYKGRLTPREKIRTKKRAIKAALAMMQAHAEDGASYNKKAFICQSACLDDAKELARLVEETFPQLDGPVEIFPIGTTIGSHTGPGTVSLFFWGDERVD